MNWLGILLASLMVFVIGGPWYGKLFRNAWGKAAGYTPEAMEAARKDESKRKHPAKVFGGSFVLGVLAAATLAWILGPNPSIVPAMMTGLYLGAGIGATSLGINYLFAGRTVALLLIDGGYTAVLFAAMGLVLGIAG